jgi:hypothetical protein
MSYGNFIFFTFHLPRDFFLSVCYAFLILAQRVDHAWNTRGIRVEYAWNTRGIRVEYAWDTRGIRVGYAWNTRGIREDHANKTVRYKRRF